MEIFVTDHAKERFAERISAKPISDSYIKSLLQTSRKLSKLPLNKYNMRFFTKHSDCAFHKNAETKSVIVTKKEENKVIIVTILNWNDHMKLCFY